MWAVVILLLAWAISILPGCSEDGKLWTVPETGCYMVGDKGPINANKKDIIAIPPGWETKKVPCQ